MTENQLKNIESNGMFSSLLGEADAKVWQARKHCESARESNWKNCKAEFAAARDCIDDAEQLVERANQHKEIIPM